MDQHVAVYPMIVHAFPFHQVQPAQQPLRQGRHPHEGFRIFGQQVQLASPFKNKDAAGKLGQFLAFYSGERQGRNIGIGVGNLNKPGEIRKVNTVHGRQSAVFMHDKHILEFHNQLAAFSCSICLKYLS